MENLPQKVDAQVVALAINNARPGTSAIDFRRKMVQLPEVAKALNTVEKYVFVASTKIPIAEINDSDLVVKLEQIFTFIAMDIGYNIPKNENEWNYIKTRLLDILNRYYASFTLSDIKLAFELATTGELDEYLPRDGQGNPDRKHYQQFNADFFAKILGAYKKKQRVVIGKAYNALPEPEKKVSTEKSERTHKSRLMRNAYLFLKYKYTGKINLEFGDDMFVYEWLQRVGWADSLNITESDRKKALAVYLGDAAAGLVNQYTAHNVRREGTASRELQFPAYKVARIREIKETFDRMISAEVQIYNLIG